MMDKENILICGFGISGQASAALAADLGYHIALADNHICTPEMKKKLLSLREKDPDLETYFGEGTFSIAENAFHKVIVSPGIRKDSALYGKALTALRKDGQIYGELQFALEYLRCPILAVTGTNGKTTTTELITHLLKANLLRAESAGNIGVPLCEFVRNGQHETLDCLCLEVSSFQLESFSSFPDVPCAILNLASDHLDRHHTMEEYASVKFKLFGSQTKSPYRVMNHSLLEYQKRFLPPGTEVTTFSGTAKESDFTLQGTKIFFRTKEVFDMACGQLQGIHNAENIMASLGLLRAFCGEEAMYAPETNQALTTFHAGPHRMERFASYNDITFVNDSKGTNPHAVNAAVQHFARGKDLLLILGGLDKGMDFSELDDSLPFIRKAFLIGQCREKLALYLQGKVSYESFETLSEAVHAVFEQAQKGECVMLSPATASMDMFANYAQRGECFKKLVMDEISCRKKD